MQQFQLMHLALNRDRQLISLYGRATAQLMVGVVILDQNGMLIESNSAATNILNSADGLRVKAGALETAYANQRQPQTAASDPRCTRVSAGPASQHYGRYVRGASVGPAQLGGQSTSSDEWTEGKQRPCMAVFVRDTTGRPDPPVKLAQKLFELTPAETSLAIELVSGLSLDEVARRSASASTWRARICVRSSPRLV